MEQKMRNNLRLLHLDEIVAFSLVRLSYLDTPQGQVTHWRQNSFVALCLALSSSTSIDYWLPCLKKTILFEREGFSPTDY